MWNEALSLFFPRTCTGCERVLLGAEVYLCTCCLSELPMRRGSAARNKIMESELAGLPCIGSCFSLLPFIKESIVQHLLHRLKYGASPELARHMGRVLGMAIFGQLETELIIPVPLHRKKEKVRGYNQSKLIAWGMAEEIKLPVLEGSLIRVRRSGSQTRMHRLQRQENMKGTFALTDPATIRGKSVLIVDDVFTTGATTRSISGILAAQGADEIHVAVLAHAE